MRWKCSTAQHGDHAKSLPRREADTWIATASAQGEAHLVPLSLSWDGSSILFLATEVGSATARNVAATGGARLAVGSGQGVVLIHASAITVPCDEADESRCATFASKDCMQPDQGVRPLGVYCCEARQGLGVAEHSGDAGAHRYA